jgi:uncharacterized protein YkwD
MKRALVLIAMVLAVTGSAAGPADAVATAPAATERLQVLEQDILIQLNAIRSSHDLRPLVPSDDLQRAAAFHSRLMLANGFFAHQSSDGSPFFVRVKRYYTAAGFEQWSVGENLLYATGAVSATAAINAWLRSPAHRKNMLSPTWREVGIGALHASSAGGTFGGAPTAVITMDFGTRSGGTAQGG